jgi:hypothetical protein
LFTTVCKRIGRDGTKERKAGKRGQDGTKTVKKRTGRGQKKGRKIGQKTERGQEEDRKGKDDATVRRQNQGPVSLKCLGGKFSPQMV